MKRNLIFAISAFALTAGSQPLFAAETETAAPQERAAPARRTAPPAARPAPQRAAPQQQAAQPSPTSSYSGAQAGGFGGGNVGGGGFADPVCLTEGGLNFGCTPVAFNHSLNKTGGIGGGVIQYMFPVNPWIVVGITGDIAGGKTTASSTQSFFYADRFSPGFATAETYTNSVSQSTNGSIRFKAGVVTPVPGWNSTIMPYFTVGWIRQKFEGTFTYSAVNFDTTGECGPFCTTVAGSSFSWSHQANGVIFGVGVDIPIPTFGPGVMLVFDYSHASFQSFDITAPVAIGAVGGSACVPHPTFICATTDNLHVSNPRSDRFTAGLRIKLL